MAIALLIAVYGVSVTINLGNLGGYPDVAHGGTVNFTLTWRGIAALFTRLPAVYVVNSLAGTPLWLRFAVLAYVTILALAVAAGARPGRYRLLLLLLAPVAELPALNIIGWMRYSAQASRFLYLPAACMSAASLWNTLAYVRMLHSVGRMPKPRPAHATAPPAAAWS